MTGELDEDYYDVANNNNIVHAGVEVNVNTNDLHIPYNNRCYAMRDSIDGNYSYFGLHSGLDWSGVQLRALSLPCHGEEDGSVSNGGGSIPRSQGSGTGNDYPSRYGSIWYFHKDHLGSSTLITDGTGSISQQVEYLPYGEVFLEKQHSSDPSQPLYATPYRFNGKELDEETGLYYYGARYYNPRLSVWYGTDPLQEFNLNISSYCFVHANPIRRIDAIGLTDYEVDNETKRIEDGHDDLRISVGTMAFDKLQTYFSNDNYSYYSEWSIESNSKLSPGFNALNDINSISMAFSRQANNVNVGDNGKWYYRQNSGRIFYSNQYVITTPASIQYSKYISGMNKAGGAIAIVSSGYDIYQGYVQDGNRFGYNAQVQTAGAIGGYALGVVGAKIGAEIGTSIGAAFGGIGAVPGGIIGGIVGGVIFSIWGNHQGQQIAKDIVK